MQKVRDGGQGVAYAAEQLLRWGAAPLADDIRPVRAGLEGGSYGATSILTPRATFFPFRMLAASTRSSRRPLVQLPRKA